MTDEKNGRDKPNHFFKVTIADLIQMIVVLGLVFGYFSSRDSKLAEITRIQSLHEQSLRDQRDRLLTIEGHVDKLRFRQYERTN